MDQDDVVAVGVHEFPDEVLVEVTGRDDQGFLAVRSYQFKYGESGLEPAQPVPEPVEETIAAALADEGYELATA